MFMHRIFLVRVPRIFAECIEKLRQMADDA